MVLMKKVSVYFLILATVFAVIGCKEKSNSDLTKEKLSFIPKGDGKIGHLYDYDDNLYKGIKLGNQIWMDRDLESERFIQGKAR